MLMRRYRGGAYILGVDIPFSAVLDTVLLPITVPGYLLFPPESLDWTTREEALGERGTSPENGKRSADEPAVTVGAES